MCYHLEAVDCDDSKSGTIKELKRSQNKELKVLGPELGSYKKRVAYQKVYTVFIRINFIRMMRLRIDEI